MARTRRERGSAAVEFALVLPILVLLVLGIIEFGRIYNVQTTVSGAARESVRTMALTNSTSSARSAAKNAAANLNLTDGQIAISPSSCPTSSAPTNVTVTITYPVTLVTKLFGTTLTVTGKGVMLCNG